MARLFVVAVLFLTCAALRAEEPKPDAPKPHAEGYKDTPMIPGTDWHVHDSDRPQPRVVTPGTESTPEKPGAPPSDATVLFDGTNVDKWEGGDHKPTKWTVDNGALVSVKGAGYVFTKDEYSGDFQLHVEWAAPVPPQGNSQGRGNSGVFLQGVYEIQVLDSYNNPTYADGTLPPPSTASTRPWSTAPARRANGRRTTSPSRAPKYKDGKLDKPAYVTVIRNGVVVQNHADIMGPTGHRVLPKYPKGPIEKGPIGLQDHGNPVRFRNIWIRELKPEDAK